MFHLKASLIYVFLVSNAFGNISPYFKIDKSPKPGRHDLRAARALEDYYWAFRRKNSRVMKDSIALVKRSKSPLFNKYIATLNKGFSLLRTTVVKDPSDCSFSNGQDKIDQKFLDQFKDVCFKRNYDSLLKQKNLTNNWLSFIEKNFKSLTRFKFRKNLVEVLKETKGSQRVYISNLVRNYIFSTKKLPPKEFLEFLIVDHKLTKFIQDHHLFEKNHLNEYTREFNNLVTQFKSYYLDGNDDAARDVLEEAISFFESNSEKIDNNKAWALFITSGKKVARKEDHSMAVEIFKISEKIGDEDQMMESKFQRLFSLYKERKLSSARTFLKEEKLLQNFGAISNKLRFWTARVLHESKEYKKAKELYKELIQIEPLSYYSILALKELRSISNQYSTTLLISDLKPEKKNLSLSEKSYRAVSLFKIFKEANSEMLLSLMESDLRSIPSSIFFKNISNQEAESYKSYFLIGFFAEHDRHLSSFKEAYSSLGKGEIVLNDLVIKSLFPYKFSSLVKEKSGKLDPNLILSLIRQESAFNVKARSVVGARGLMQIMPATGKQLYRKLQADQLYEPSLNIKLGTRYLSGLMERYEGNIVFSLASYNAGIGNVSRWQRDIPFNSDMISNIEMIPFKETRNYVKLIYRNIFFYNYMEGRNEFINLPTNDSFFFAYN